jgi:3-oxoacyl-[acyl-carrier protein] reductase
MLPLIQWQWGNGPTAGSLVKMNLIIAGTSPLATDMVGAAWQQHRDRYLERIPLRRMAAPAEVAAAVLFLASERASYMTGATMHVNGGMEMR